MNIGLFSADPKKTYGDMFTAPYWLYTVLPRTCDEPVYRKEVVSLEADIHNGDTLEIFILDKRVLFAGAQIEIALPSEVVLQPTTRDGIVFDPVYCGTPQKKTYMPYGGILDRATDVKAHSFVVEEPDYFGFKVLSGAENIPDLLLIVTLSVLDDFAIDSKTNSTKGT